MEQSSRIQQLNLFSRPHETPYTVFEKRRRFLTLIALLGTLLLWASSFAGIEVALKSYTAIEVAVLRYIIASFALVIYALVQRMPLPMLRDLPGIVFTGFLGFTLYNVALNAGQQSVSAGAASFIISSEVAMIALLASVFFGERLSVRGWLGIVICTVGIGIITVASNDDFSVTWGAVYVFVAMLSVSVYSVTQKPFLARYDAVQFTTYAILGGDGLSFALCAIGFACGTAGDI